MLTIDEFIKRAREELIYRMRAFISEPLVEKDFKLSCFFAIDAGNMWTAVFGSTQFPMIKAVAVAPQESDIACCQFTIYGELPFFMPGDEKEAVDVNNS